LFEAISACSNLNPDPADSEDDEEDYRDRIVFEGEALEGFSGGVFGGSTDGGLPPPMPGSSGWITAENMHEYFDENGNWIGEGGEDEDEGEPVAELGEGAGSVHPRTEEEEEDAPGGAEDGVNKRQRGE
jgi:nucleotide-sensitive chloride channel 1A